MNTEDRSPVLASEPNWVCYIDSLNTAGLAERAREPSVAAASPAATGEKIFAEPANWADYVDRLYIDQLMRSLEY